MNADFSSSPPHHHMNMAISGHGMIEYWIVLAGLITVLLVGYYTIKFFIYPREQNPDHIKRRVLRDDF